MDTETLFYKEHNVSDHNVEIFFHKDYTYLCNETDAFPVVKFVLINCKNLWDIQFDDLDYYNDGLAIDVNKEIDQSIFEMTDMGGEKTQISCDDVTREHLTYRRSDLMDIIKSIKRESDDNYERGAALNNKIESLITTLKHNLDIIQRKLEQANWLNQDKKQFLKGQEDIIKQVLEFIDRNQKEDFQKKKPEQRSKQE